MRALTIAFFLLAGCDRDEGSKQTTLEAQPAQITFDGGDYSTAAAEIAHGERLTKVLGCRGCHSKDLQGKLWDDDPKEYGTMWASNLTRSVPAMSDAELRDLLTKGTHPRRSELWVMPSELFQHLAEPDLAALLAYLRTLRPAGKPSPDPTLGPRALSEIASGEIKSTATLVTELRNVGPADLGPQHAAARYFTRVTCAECHGPELKGVPKDTPDLIVVAAYSPEEFERLITRGEAKDGRKIAELMTSVSRSRFSQMTPRERSALYSYLKARAEQPQ